MKKTILCALVAMIILSAQGQIIDVSYSQKVNGDPGKLNLLDVPSNTLSSSETDKTSASFNYRYAPPKVFTMNDDGRVQVDFRTKWVRYSVLGSLAGMVLWNYTIGNLARDPARNIPGAASTGSFFVFSGGIAIGGFFYGKKKPKFKTLYEDYYFSYR